MAVNKDQVEQMLRNTQGIPANPEVAAKMAVEGAFQSEQPVTPPGLEPASPVDQGLDPSADAADFFGGLAADMDAETQSTPEPRVPEQQPYGVEPVEELPYEPPVHQRQPGEMPESLEPRVGPEGVPLEAAIEQPLVEEDLRLTAEQWAASQRAMTTPSEPEPVAQQQMPDPAQLEAQAIDTLLQTEYVLSEDDKNALIAEPDKVLPRLAARMHVRMQVQTAQQLAQILPAMIQQQIQQATKVQGLESSFFGQYPELNKPEYRKTVAESLTMIRNVNPEASREEVMRDGAALAAVRLKTRLGEARPPAPVAATPQNMPLAAPVQRHAPQSQGPFTPAQSGGGTEPVVPTDPNQDNIFAVLANDPNW
jgi:hypothetical protein